MDTNPDRTPEQQAARVARRLLGEKECVNVDHCGMPEVSMWLSREGLCNHCHFQMMMHSARRKKEEQDYKQWRRYA